MTHRCGCGFTELTLVVWKVEERTDWEYEGKEAMSQKTVTGLRPGLGQQQAG